MAAATAHTASSVTGRESAVVVRLPFRAPVAVLRLRLGESYGRLPSWTMSRNGPAARRMAWLRAWREPIEQPYKV